MDSDDWSVAGLDGGMASARLRSLGLGELGPVRLAVGEDFDLGDLARALVDAAYIRVDLVEA